MIRTIRQLENSLNQCIEEKEILIKDETGEVMIIDTLSIEDIDGDSKDIRYMLSCKKAGNGCVAYK